MALLASTVIAESQALLNDISGDIYTSAALIPFLKKALRELQEVYIVNAIPFPHKFYTETIETPDTTFDTPPADLIFPVRLYERTPGESDDNWIPMTEKEWEPNSILQQNLGIWVWRQGVVSFLGASTNREVKMRYEASFTAIVDGTSTIVVTDAQTFLASRVAAIAALVVGSNRERAEPLAEDAKDALERLVVAAIKQRQNLPVRRAGYTTHRRASRRLFV
jgi:hypothetical protein